MNTNTKGEGLDNKDLEGTSVKGSAFFCADLWNEIEEDLGEITDVSILDIDSPFFKIQVNYRSNGELKSCYLGNIKPLIASLCYVLRLKKYESTSLNHQHIPLP